MAIRNVPGTYATIQAAIAASSPGDIIEIAAGYTNESALVTVNNLTFTGPSNVTGIVLNANGTITSITLAGEAPIEVRGASADETITGNAAANVINGGGGNDTLNGGVGADSLTGLGGNDRYIVDNAADQVFETSGGGNDTVFASQLVTSYTLTAGQEIEALATTKYAGTAPINLTGNEFANTITGNAGNNVLNGGGGNDTLIGSLGDDTYIVDTAADQIVEAVGEGVDTVAVSQLVSSYTLAAGQEIEILATTKFAGTAPINLTGNELANTIIGNAGANTLDGGDGNDRLNGGLGNDTLKGGRGRDTYITDGTDTIIEVSEFNSIDTVESSVTYTLGNNLENLTLTGTGAINGTGNDDSNVITGTAADNILDGGAGGRDRLVGLGGNDSYFVVGLGTQDEVVEATGGGDDKVYARTGYTLPAGQEIETLATTDVNSTQTIELTGNEFDNTIIGNAGVNVLEGREGRNTLIGGRGNDIYVYYGNDTIVEDANGGIDTVQTATDYTLGANLENIKLLDLSSPSNPSGIGNALDNTIEGNNAANILDGGAGTDTLIGRGGNDTYIVDNVADKVIEQDSQSSNDTVFTRGSYALQAGQSIENLATTSFNSTRTVNLTGNEFANTITGNAGANTLDGGGGSDTLNGSLGDDTYVIDGGDTIVEAANGGTDAVRSSATYTLATNVDNLTLTGTTAINGTGNALKNAITGNGQVNVLDGGGNDDTFYGSLGADTLYGRDGADTFTFRSTAESSNSSRDTIADFSQAQNDRIDLLVIDANTTSTATGNEAFSFIGAAAFTNQAGQLRYQFDGGNTLVQGDTDGNGVADFTIVLNGRITLEQSAANQDFVL